MTQAEVRMQKPRIRRARRATTGGWSWIAFMWSTPTGGELLYGYGNTPAAAYLAYVNDTGGRYYGSA